MEARQCLLSFSAEFLSSTVLSTNLKIKVYRTIILPVVLYGHETPSLILGEEHKLRVFEKRVLRKIFRPKRDEVTWEWRRVLNKELMICTSHPILFGLSNQKERDRQGMLVYLGKRRGAV